MNYIVLSHLGLGDHIIMNGYIHYLRTRADTNRICIVVFNNYSKSTLVHLYMDYPSISFYYMDSSADTLFSMINRQPWMSTCIYENETYHILTFGLHSQHQSIYHGDLCWNSSFYIHAGVDPSIQFSHFTLPNDMSRSIDKYNQLVKQLGTDQYIIIHDDPSRKRYIHENTVIDILKNNKHDNLPVIYFGINRYEYPLLSNVNNAENVNDILACSSLLDYYHILLHATECHLMDSSILCLTDQIVNSSSLLYDHLYVVHTDFSSKNITAINRNWNILFT
jgi:hypothetical protein